MIGIVTAVCSVCVLCLALPATRLIAIAGLVVVTYFYPWALVPIFALLAGAFFLSSRF